MKLRLRYTKLGKVRFISHRDTARVWERALRRADVPVASSEGFTPRPKISFGLALPTGAESLAEYLDVEIRADDAAALDLCEDATLPGRLSDVLPAGIAVVAAAPCPAADGSLQDSVTSVTWELWSDQIDRHAIEAATGLLDADELVVERERKGRRRADDIRPLLLDLCIDAAGDHLVADLATSGRALRPAELAALAFPGVDPVDVRALRTHQWINDGDQRREVLSLPVVVPALDRTVSA